MLKGKDFMGEVKTKELCSKDKMYVQIEQANAISEVALPNMKNFSADYIDLDKIDFHDKILIGDSNIQKLIRTSQKRGGRYALAINEEYTMELCLTIIPLDRDNLDDLADFSAYELPSSLVEACKQLSDRLLNISDLPVPAKVVYDTYPNTLLHALAKIEDKSDNLILRKRKIIPGLEWNQRQDIYAYDPKAGNLPKLVGKDIESFAEMLDTDSVDNQRIQQQLFKGRDANASEDLFKKYLAKVGYYLNPSKEDLEAVNEKAGLPKEVNLSQVIDSNLLEIQY